MRRNIRKRGIQSLASQTRVEAREALLQAIRGDTKVSDKLMTIAAQIEGDCKQGFHSEGVTRHYSAYAGLLQCAARLASWTSGERACELDAGRFLRGAKIRADEIDQTAYSNQLIDWSTYVTTVKRVKKISGVIDVYRAILSIPLPIVEALDPSYSRGPFPSEAKISKPPIVVAFTSFLVNGQPFTKDHQLNLNIAYDLGIELALSRWPEEEEHLHLEPLSVEPADSYELPSFSVSRPNDNGPQKFKLQRRMVVKRANSFLARPMEFSYRARFSSSKEVVVEGQRHLSVRCFDPKRDPLSGYEQVDLKLVSLRDQARAASAINDSDLNNLLVLMAAVGGVAGQSLQDNRFAGSWSEKEFQDELKGLLRARPTIGSELEEHPQVSGGITDLSFRHIRLELKVIDDHHVTQDDLNSFIPQTAQYVAGSDKRFGVLCILDASLKTEASGSAADDVGYQLAKGPSGLGLPLGIGTVIIRGNLSRPSSLKAKKNS